MLYKDARMIGFPRSRHLGKTTGPLRVMIAIITVWSFLCTSLSPTPFTIQEAWAARTPAELSSVGSDGGGGLSVSGEVPGEARAVNPENFTLPEHLGSIRDSWVPPDWETGELAKRQVIIHIQDAHCNYEAQHTLADILDYLTTKYGIETVNLEGGVEDYDLTPFTSINNPDIRAEVADDFVKSGRVNGAEYFAITNPGRATLWGVEDTKLYIDNLSVYTESLKYKEAVDEDLGQLGAILTNLKLKIYPQDLMELDARYVQYKAGNMDFKDYLTYLIGKAGERGIDLKDLPSIYLLHRTIEDEETVDFKKANNEREDLIAALQRKLSKRSLNELLSKTIEFRAERLSQKTFYTYLAERAAMVNIDMAAYPHLQKYIDYISLYAAIDKSKVMEEMGDLETRLKETMFQNETQRRLDALSKNLTLMKNIFAISLSRDDYRYFTANRPAFETRNFVDFIRTEAPRYRVDARLNEKLGRLDGYLDDITKFYDYSFKRDEAFLANMKVGESPVIASTEGPRKDEVQKHAAIIITGGFHTENLCELFRRNNIAYVSIMPNFTSPEGYVSPYFELLGGQKTETEKAIEAALASIQIASKLNSLGITVDGKKAANIFDISIQMDRAIRQDRPLELMRPIYAADGKTFLGAEVYTFTGTVDAAGNLTLNEPKGRYLTDPAEIDALKVDIVIGPLLTTASQASLINPQIVEAKKSDTFGQVYTDTKGNKIDLNDDIEAVAGYMEDVLGLPGIAEYLRNSLTSLYGEDLGPRINFVWSNLSHEDQAKRFGWTGHAGRMGIYININTPAHLNADGTVNRLAVQKTLVHETMAYFFTAGHTLNDAVADNYETFAETGEANAMNLAMAVRDLEPVEAARRLPEMEADSLFDYTGITGSLNRARRALTEALVSPSDIARKDDESLARAKIQNGINTDIIDNRYSQIRNELSSLFEGETDLESTVESSLTEINGLRDDVSASDEPMQDPINFYHYLASNEFSIPWGNITGIQGLLERTIGPVERAPKALERIAAAEKEIAALYREALENPDEWDESDVRTLERLAGEANNDAREAALLAIRLETLLGEGGLLGTLEGLKRILGEYVIPIKDQWLYTDALITKSGAVRARMTRLDDLSKRVGKLQSDLRASVTAGEATKTVDDVINELNARKRDLIARGVYPVGPATVPAGDILNSADLYTGTDAGAGFMGWYKLTADPTVIDTGNGILSITLPAQEVPTTKAAVGAFETFELWGTDISASKGVASSIDEMQEGIWPDTKTLLRMIRTWLGKEKAEGPAIAVLRGATAPVHGIGHRSLIAIPDVRSQMQLLRERYETDRGRAMTGAEGAEWERRIRILTSISLFHEATHSYADTMTKGKDAKGKEAWEKAFADQIYNKELTPESRQWVDDYINDPARPGREQMRFHYIIRAYQRQVFGVYNEMLTEVIRGEFRPDLQLFQDLAGEAAGEVVEEKREAAPDALTEAFRAATSLKLTQEAQDEISEALTERKLDYSIPEEFKTTLAGSYADVIASFDRLVAEGLLKETAAADFAKEISAKAGIGVIQALPEIADEIIGAYRNDRVTDGKVYKYGAFVNILYDYLSQEEITLDANGQGRLLESLPDLVSIHNKVQGMVNPVPAVDYQRFSRGLFARVIAEDRKQAPLSEVDRQAGELRPLVGLAGVMYSDKVATTVLTALARNIATQRGAAAGEYIKEMTDLAKVLERSGLTAKTKERILVALASVTDPSASLEVPAALAEVIAAETRDAATYSQALDGQKVLGSLATADRRNAEILVNLARPDVMTPEAIRAYRQISNALFNMKADSNITQDILLRFSRATPGELTAAAAGNENDVKRYLTYTVKNAQDRFDEWLGRWEPAELPAGKVAFSQEDLWTIYAGLDTGGLTGLTAAEAGDFTAVDRAGVDTILGKLVPGLQPAGAKKPPDVIQETMEPENAGDVSVTVDGITYRLAVNDSLRADNYFSFTQDGPGQVTITVYATKLAADTRTPGEDEKDLLARAVFLHELPEAMSLFDPEIMKMDADMNKAGKKIDNTLHEASLLLEGYLGTIMGKDGRLLLATIGPAMERIRPAAYGMGDIAAKEYIAGLTAKGGVAREDVTQRQETVVGAMTSAKANDRGQVTRVVMATADNEYAAAYQGIIRDVNKGLMANDYGQIGDNKQAVQVRMRIDQEKRVIVENFVKGVNFALKDLPADGEVVVMAPQMETGNAQVVAELQKAFAGNPQVTILQDAYEDLEYPDILFRVSLGRKTAFLKTARTDENRRDALSELNRLLSSATDDFTPLTSIDDLLKRVIKIRRIDFESIKEFGESQRAMATSL